MRPGLRSAHGFSLTELMLVVAFATTLMAISVPIVSDITQSSKLSEASRMVERELQVARMKAVNINRPMRVRLNCPGDGYLRMVEVTGTAADSADNRCLESAYPYPAADQDVMTLPNHDGPLHMLPVGATVTTAVFQFQPEGTVYQIVAGAAQSVTTPVTLTITRNGKSKTVTVNGAGKIQLQ